MVRPHWAHDRAHGAGEPALGLTRGNSCQACDGLLRASDIVNLRLRSDLAILSACSTAPSSEACAEPFAGLAGAFMIAGAKAVLASHWSVDTHAAESLTTGTINQWRAQRREPALALQSLSAPPNLARGWTSLSAEEIDDRRGAQGPRTQQQRRMLAADESREAKRRRHGNVGGQEDAESRS